MGVSPARLEHRAWNVMEKETLEVSLWGSRVPKASHRDALQTPLESWGLSLHTCLNTENAVPTCHIISFESPSGLRDELGFILGGILKRRHEGTLRHHAHHPASLQPSPPAPGGTAARLQKKLLGPGAAAAVWSAPHLGHGRGPGGDFDRRGHFPTCPNISSLARRAGR